MATEKRIQLRGIDPLSFYGLQDENLRALEQLFQIDLIGRGQELILRGDDELVGDAERIISELVYMLNKNGSLSPEDIETVFRLSRSPEQRSEEHDLESIVLYTKGGTIKPKTPGQTAYFKSCKKNDIVVAISTSGNSGNVIEGARAAKGRGLKVVALTGYDGGILAKEADIPINVGANNTARVQEVHVMVIHLLCKIIEGILA